MTKLKSFAGHINNLYNTTFWALVQQGDMDATQAEERLKVFLLQCCRCDGPFADLVAGHNSIGEERNPVFQIQEKLQ